MSGSHRRAFSCFGLGKKLLFVISLLVQIFRIYGTGLLCYQQYTRLVIKRESLNLFDQPYGSEESSQAAEEYSEYRYFTDKTGEETVNPDLELDKVQLSNIKTRSTEDDEIDISSTNGLEKKNWLDVTMLIIPLVEVMTSLILICTIMGPLTKNVSMRQWIAWLLRMRVFWMRLMWTGTGIAYLFINTKYRKLMFESTSDPQYVDSPEWIVMLAVTCFEYFLLGVLECIMKITNCEVIQGKIRGSNVNLSLMWQKIGILTYNICLLAYAIRNFSLSLYFALLSVGVNDDSSTFPNKFTGLTLVIQIYLTIIRGRFYGFFMHGFLSTFLYEEDNPVFDKARIKKDHITNDVNNHDPEKNFLQREEVFDENYRNSSWHVNA